MSKTASRTSSRDTLHTTVSTIPSVPLLLVLRFRLSFPQLLSPLNISCLMLLLQSPLLLILFLIFFLTQYYFCSTSGQPPPPISVHVMSLPAPHINFTHCFCFFLSYGDCAPALGLPQFSTYQLVQILLAQLLWLADILPLQPSASSPQSVVNHSGRRLDDRSSSTSFDRHLSTMPWSCFTYSILFGIIYFLLISK